MENNYIKCDSCKEYHWTQLKCDPVFNVTYKDGGIKEIRAYDHEEAATKFAEYYNTNSDYCLMGGDGIKISIEKDGEIKYYEVYAEVSIDYSAKEL